MSNRARRQQNLPATVGSIAPKALSTLAETRPNLSEDVAGSRVWLVGSGREAPLGEVEAVDHAGALTQASLSWPGIDSLRVSLKSSYEAICHKLQAKIDRNPGPTCYHEAAHAVVGLMLEKRSLIRVAVRAQVYIGLDFDSRGTTEWGPDANPYGIFDSSQRPSAEARIVSTMAGVIAESRCRGRKRPLPLEGSDLGLVRQLAIFHSGGTSLSPIGRNQIIDLKYLGWLNIVAKVRVAESWAIIDHVAKALIERRELSGKEVSDLMAEVNVNNFPSHLENLRAAFP